MSHNQAHYRVYAALRGHEILTQPELAYQTKLSLPAVIQAVRRLEKNNLLLEQGEQRGQGRPAKRFRTSPELHHILAIDLGGSSLQAAIFDLYGKQLEQIQTISMYRFSKLSREDALAHLREVVEQFPRAKRIGICSPGIVTPFDALERSWIFGLRTLERHSLEQYLGKPVILENDARSAAWGEFRRGRGTNNSAFIIFAFGIGAGIVSDGKLMRGTRGMSGELSYLPANFEVFAQPRLGSLAYDFFDILRSVSPDPRQDHWEAEVFQAAFNGSKKAKNAIQKAVQHIAFAIAGVITTLDPERIILRQEFPHTKELVLEPIKAMLSNIGLATSLELSSLGKDAGLIGVGLLAAERLEAELLGL